ncbi:hypothetical protein GQ457_15G006320 [Hibiscus cannabinus]
MGWAIAIHGGAGVPPSLPPDKRLPLEAGLRHCLDVGIAALQALNHPLDVVELVVHASWLYFYVHSVHFSNNLGFCQIICFFYKIVGPRVRELENHPCFNAGMGSVLTSRGTIEMEASIMDGKTMKCGAVSGLSTVVNPVSLARLVMEKTPHVYLAFDGAEAFARDQGVETAEMSHFITPDNIERLKHAQEAGRVQIDHTQPDDAVADGDGRIGTVGCVAVDNEGNLAAATSTGGMVNKMVGRIGHGSQPTSRIQANIDIFGICQLIYHIQNV